MKLRAWDNKGMVLLDWWCICQTAFNRVDQDNYGLLYRILTNQANPNDGHGFVVMLCSELKDKTGKNVYAGDIINLADKYRYIVKFEEGKFVCEHVKSPLGRWGDLKRLSDPDFDQYHHEVIGNIYQNPELLNQ